MGRVSMSDNRHSVNLEVPAGRARGLARTSSVQASTRLCTRAHPRARVHVPRARMHIDEHACMCLVHACISASTYSCASCTHAQRHACVQRHVHVCGVDVLACSPMCMRPRACAGFETGVHPCSFTAHVRFSVFAVRLPRTCLACFLSCCRQSDPPWMMI